jgi:diaminohydroxyphosphoribosylaminopyrimidine deaminase/5-amino-6-(5-phosphoribosylamino)uracil reductase
MTAFTDTDRRCMVRALALARRGQGRVEPNPMVGAVTVRDGRVVGEGYHQRFGANHAEVNALVAAGNRRNGATLYVTLEPCCHWGKTPPCTEAILRSGIRRVVVASVDPFPRVRGRGITILRKAGVQVDVGLLEAESRQLLAPFITRQTLHRPYVIAKWAQSLDGRVAFKRGRDSFSARRPQWISSEVSREFVHKLRGRMDAILIGINTALVDDPLLTARPKNRRDLRRTPTRIVLDSQCRLPVTSRLVRTVPEAPLLVAHAGALGQTARRRRDALAARGAMMLPLSVDRDGHPGLAPLLRHLADRDYTNLLVEGGPTLLATFFQQDLVDETHVFLAPILIGGDQAPHAVGGGNNPFPAGRPLNITSIVRSGPDLHVTLHRADG